MTSLFRTALVLALMSLVGPFAIDMFLPALPQMAADLGSTEAEAQITLSAYFVTFGLAQLIYGPWADQAGRKQPLYAGLTIFLIGSIGCALSTNMTMLVAFRAMQGFGAGAPGVVPRAIIRDRYTGAEATKLMSLVMLVISVSPMLAPLTGSFVISFATWRAIFWSLTIVSAISLIALTFFQPETLPKEKRQPVKARALLRSSGVLFRDARFMGLTFIGAFAISSFFVFIASASFVYTDQFGMTPTQFSLAFAVNAIGFFGMSQAASFIGGRIGMDAMVRYGVFGFASFTIGLFIVTLLFGAHLAVIIPLLFCANACLGVVMPSSMVMALDDHGEIAGLASSLGGALQMLTGAFLVAILSFVFDGTALPMLMGIAACGVMTLVCLAITMRAQPKLA